MTIEEMAQAIIEINPEDEAALRDWADGETAAFQEYLSEYHKQAQARRACKGCHGG